MNIHDLAKTRAECAAYLEALGTMNAAPLHEWERKLAQDAAYQLAKDAYFKAEADYQRAISTLTTDELRALAAPRKQAAA